MKQRKTTTVNAGYSFVEMLIVLAIMAIISAMAVVTWNSVNKARYQKAVSNIESELDTLRLQTMAQDRNMAFRIIYDPDYEESFGRTVTAYVIERGYMDDSGFVAVSRTSAGSTLKADYYGYKGVSDPIFLMKQGTIEYSQGGVTKKVEDTTGLVIQYKKSDGSILKGPDSIRVIDAKGNTVTSINLVKLTGTYYETY